MGFEIHSGTSSDKNGRSNDSSSILFNSCEGLQSEIEVNFLNDGSSLERVIPVRGRKLGGVITFSRGVAESGSSANEFFSWFLNVCDSSKILKKKILNIMLVESENSNKVLARWEVKGAWPCRWSGPLLEISGNTPTLEHISFAYESIQKA